MTAAPTTEEYRFLCDLIYEHSRIHLGSDKRELVAARLGRRLRATQTSTFGEYCDYLRRPGAGEELSRLVDVISTNHTHFFREQKHFDFLTGTALPKLEPALRGTPFRCWSAASSSGEEPYSIAITLAEHAARRPAFRWELDSSDICTDMVAKAQQGIYAESRMSGIPPELVRRYFQKGSGEWADSLRVKLELRAPLRWHQLNLFQPRYPFHAPFHLIFCRNVMIYFDRPSQEELVGRLSELLVPGGYLFIGHSESLTGIRHGLQTILPAIYRLPETASR